MHRRAVRRKRGLRHERKGVNAVYPEENESEAEQGASDDGHDFHDRKLACARTKTKAKTDPNGDRGAQFHFLLVDEERSDFALQRLGAIRRRWCRASPTSTNRSRAGRP